ncbi:hypothetical protein [Leptolyngbya sp. PCC 6406]|uniref:hypothetical protein n=1 Tax=Leptolyngbya sp. PCC 6406 TaxID=1173264 RepID=UPI0002AC8A55|nr:hypothetical protein [Leptolyngbya sp. PCC 6406]
MFNPADSGYSWQALLSQYQTLTEFKGWLPEAVGNWLDTCEWTLTAQAGEGGIPLMVLRCPGRVRLRHPLLLQLAEVAQIYWGPLDFSLFSGEATTPVRVLSTTLLDLGHRL